MWPPSEIVLKPGCPYQERLQSKLRLRLVLGQPGSGNVPKIIAQQFINYQLAKNKFQNHKWQNSLAEPLVELTDVKLSLNLTADYVSIGHGKY